MLLMGKEGRKAMKEHGDVASIGIEMGISVLIGVLFGRYLDGVFPTDILGGKLFLVLGMMLGLAAGFKSLYLIARKTQRELDAEQS